MVGEFAALQDGGRAPVPQLYACDWRRVDAEDTLVILVIFS